MEVAVPAFLLGLTCSFGHCVGMCHPFVLFISNRFPEVGYKLLIPHLKYNFGRILTYSFMGFIAGILGSTAIISQHPLLRKFLTIIAGIFLITIAILGILNKHISAPDIFKKFKLNFLNSPLIIGILLGFLPCGMTMGALIAALAYADLRISTLYMLLFGIGTSAGLFLLALFGSLAVRYIGMAKIVFSIILLFTGIRFVYRGLIFM